MEHSLHIVVSDPAAGEVKPLYVGADALKANEVFEGADHRHEAVRLFSYPLATRVRFPAQDAADIEQRAKDTEFAKGAAARKLQAQADANLAEAKRLTDEAAALTAQAQPETEGEDTTDASVEPEKRKKKK